jgi:hypothetical protein
MYNKSILTIISILAISIFAGTTHASLVAQYQFEGNANDSSGYGYNATLKDGATIMTDTERGQVLSLNGTSAYVSCPTAFTSVTSSSTKSIMAWVKSKTSTYQWNTPIIQLYRSNNGDTGYDIFAAQNGKWQGRYVNGSAIDIDSGSAINANAWTHIAMVQNGSSIDFYVNGILAKHANNAGTNQVYSASWADIGAYDNGTGIMNAFFNGYIDDARIYTNALSQSEIQAIMVPEPASLILIGLGAILLKRRSRI